MAIMIETSFYEILKQACLPARQVQVDVINILLLLQEKSIQRNFNSVSVLAGEVGAGRKTESVLEKGFAYGSAVVGIVCENGLQVHRFP